MMRAGFDEQLDLLNKELITMGSLCEGAIAGIARALGEEKPEIAQEVFDLYAQISQKEREIESICLRLLLQRQPVAKDLRTVSSALKMVTDMARIGAQSTDIAEIVILANIRPSADTQVICDMAAAAIKMVTDSIDSFVKKDAELAESVIAYDDVVDAYFDQIKKLLIGLSGRPDVDGEYVIDLLMIAKYLERIADHAGNVAKWVLFSITGTRPAVAGKQEI